jgi:ketosteroid isomerase-like protein
MSEGLNRQTVERLFAALIEGDLEEFHDQFDKDSVIEFPQSGERIVGDENQRRVYHAFPGRPSLRRILTGGNIALVEAGVDYGDGIDWTAVFIYELQNAKIARATIYWTQPFEAAESRAAWVERIDA